MQPKRNFTPWRRAGLALSLAAVLATQLTACDVPTTDQPQNRPEAYRFLNQATFGWSEADMNSVGVIGYTQWITDQLATPSEQTFKEHFEKRRAEMGFVTIDQVYEAFYTRALTSKAQLRNRVLLALSEIFVVSFQDTTLGDRPELVVSYLDMLDQGLNSTYRDLLEKVATSPAMGYYLTYLANAKEDPLTGTLPDENFAREVMQLFSIGLYQLNPDGSLKRDANGAPIETYTMSDVKGLAKVFTGWTANHGPSVSATDRRTCFYAEAACRDLAGRYMPMVDYPEYHSTGEKNFLGVTIPASSTPDARGDLKIALDTLANHPNTAPFISRQLIQRLVSSNPSPAYVKRVTTRFLATGGHIGETVKAVLLDQEARSLLAPSQGTFGKLREPVLRMTAVLRAFKFTDPELSPTGGTLNTAGKASHVSIAKTSDIGTSLGQTPFYSPSVFNFFRPGYVLSQSVTAQAGLVAPEFQLVSETSVTGYTNFMADMIANGVSSASFGSGQLLGPKLNLADQRSVAADDAALITHMTERLLGGVISAPLNQAILTVLQTMVPPASNGTQAGNDARNAVLDQRSKAVILMIAASPEFLIQR
jgi:uncharacterized protein (DUF1800 family)